MAEKLFVTKGDIDLIRKTSLVVSWNFFLLKLVFITLQDRNR
jgi:hypothetical protein